jgi:hypothetical protein
MPPAILTAILAITVARALAGASDDFPIAQLQYRNGSRLVHLHSPYGFVAKWDGGKASFFTYDTSRANITATGDLESFIRALSSWPVGAEVAWVNTCGAPLHYGMPGEKVSRIQSVLESKRFKTAGTEENNFVLCTCEATILSFFTQAQLPAGGVGKVCISRVPVGERWDANNTGAKESSKFVIQIDKVAPVLIGTNTSALVTNLSLTAEHSVKIKLDGKPLESFRFSFKGRENHLRLWYNPFYGSWSLWDVRPGEKCACPKLASASSG